MKITSRVAFGLGLFVLTAGAVYGLTAHERTGATLLLILAIGFGYLGLVMRGAARAGDESASAPEGSVHEEEVVGPTIWPFGFSVAAVGLVLGVVVNRWLLIVGGVAFAVCCLGWFKDIRRQHAPASGGPEHDAGHGSAGGS
ncbi:MAG TPA: hypothetical protein DIT48_12685 [Actinobacteria bacterium]|nr:hypothetical protein [Actinomycetota bacterium]